jgi:DNA mismatch repair protein MutS
MTPKNRKEKSLTPLMRQFYEVKDKHPDKILFFRMGDFYEMFGDDAIKAAPILNITLTSRSHGNSESIPLAGVPYHSADKYLSRLLSAGEKVVVVEQVEDPKTAKGLVKRDIVEILTPGTATIDSPDTESKGICLVSIVQNGNSKMGLAALDLSTGSFLVDEGEIDDISERLKVLEPTEIIFPSLYDRDELINTLGLIGYDKILTDFGDWNFDARTAESDLNRHFGTTTLDGFGIGGNRLALSAAGAIFRYLKENYRNQLDHIDKITRIDSSEFMQLDYSTVRNLELVKNISSATEDNTLLSITNRCNTSAGSRRLKNGLLRPLKSKSKIELRLTGVAELVANRELAKSIRLLTKTFPDLEKMTGRLGIGKLNPRQMKSIGTALNLSLQIKETILKSNSLHLINLGSCIPDSKQIIETLSDALVENPPLTINKGDIFQIGYSFELDELNDSIKDARAYIGSLQKIERERTNIPSLKVGFNKVFGYYIEITKTHSVSAPEDYIRKQTLVNAERYITPELKEKEELILNAEEKIFKLEERLYQKLQDYLGQYIADLKNTADLIAEIDLVSGLAELAIGNNYCRPEIYEDSRLNIVNGRHPVVENVLPAGSFVANDARLNDDDMIQILTGPNMSGKSTYLRQIGLIVILAQIGSYVPADSAEIGLVDRVFTRVGALDNLAQGQSTFLVEMIETSNILHNSTERSLVLLDEVGRGTSTFDGMSIAWAVVEYINESIKARTIFATHYHELTGMSELYPRIHNYQVAVKKWEKKVIFLHQIIPGGCDDSYGIEVAKLAGIPRKVISRGNQILKLLESGKFNQSEIGKSIYKDKVQTTLFEKQDSEIEKKISDSDLDNLTPIEALNFLRQLKEGL